MATRNERPYDFGLMVRTSPGMFVTSPAKMSAGEKRRISFAGFRPESTSFEADDRRRKLALDHLERLFEAVAGEQGSPAEDSSRGT